ncbi:MAG: hypothetical protein B7Y81_18985 [Caulobacter sp. 32-67-35]|nr:MAG: hypothetical protein B7Y81_18985 [Caulobacter sp. 32-67-35]
MTPERLERLERLAKQASARLDNAKARLKSEERKQDTRRKIIMGSLLIDAAQKDPRWRNLFDQLMRRVDREHDRKAFEGWKLETQDADAPGFAQIPSANQGSLL